MEKHHFLNIAKIVLKNIKKRDYEVSNGTSVNLFVNLSEVNHFFNCS